MKIHEDLEEIINQVDSLSEQLEDLSHPSDDYIFRLAEEEEERHCRYCDLIILEDVLYAADQVKQKLGEPALLKRLKGMEIHDLKDKNINYELVYFDLMEMVREK